MKPINVIAIFFGIILGGFQTNISVIFTTLTGIPHLSLSIIFLMGVFILTGFLLGMFGAGKDAFPLSFIVGFLFASLFNFSGCFYSAGCANGVEMFSINQPGVIYELSSGGDYLLPAMVAYPLEFMLYLFGILIARYEKENKTNIGINIKLMIPDVLHDLTAYNVAKLILGIGLIIFFLLMIPAINSNPEKDVPLGYFIVFLFMPSLVVFVYVKGKRFFSRLLRRPGA